MVLHLQEDFGTGNLRTIRLVATKKSRYSNLQVA